MSEQHDFNQLALSCVIRRFHPADGPGVTRLVREVYGDSYYPPALYDSQKVLQLNETGKLVSVLAVKAENEVVGRHGGLCRGTAHLLSPLVSNVCVGHRPVGACPLCRDS